MGLETVITMINAEAYKTPLGGIWKPQVLGTKSPKIKAYQYINVAY